MLIYETSYHCTLQVNYRHTFCITYLNHVFYVHCYLHEYADVCVIVLLTLHVNCAVFQVGCSMDVHIHGHVARQKAPRISS
jgi:cytochrome b subunit of formate dehydrogenase